MEKKKGYSMFERDKLDPADSMRIERNIYFEEQTADLSGLTALPLEQLQALREEYAAAEQAAFEALQEQAAVRRFLPVRNCGGCWCKYSMKASTNREWISLFPCHTGYSRICGSAFGRRGC